MGNTPLSVNKVDSAGRIYVPLQVREELIGEQMAMSMPDEDTIVMERVTVNDD